MTKRPDGGDFSARNGDLSKEEIREIIGRLDALESDFTDMLSQVTPLSQRRLRDLAGSHFDRMLRSREDTLRYLNDPDPRLRQAALQLAHEYWQPGDTSPGMLERMAVSDPSDSVRGTAIRALESCFARTKDRRVAHFLAVIARNDSLSDELRLTAFMSLLRVHRIMYYCGKSPLVPRSLDEVDWEFVDGYYRSASEDGEKMGGEKT
jgi:hypothetical protein